MLKTLTSILIYILLSATAFAQQQTDLNTIQNTVQEIVTNLDKLQNRLDIESPEDSRSLLADVEQERERLNEAINILSSIDNNLSNSESKEAIFKVPSSEINRAEALDEREIGNPDFQKTIKRLIESAENARGTLDGLSTELSRQEFLRSVASKVNDRSTDIETARRRIREATDTTALLALREELRDMRSDLDKDIETIVVGRERLTADIKSLAAPPPESGIGELPEITKERDAMEARLVKADAIIKQSELNTSELSRLLRNITERRKELFYEKTFKRGPSPLSLSAIKDAQKNAVQGIGVFKVKYNEWINIQSLSGGLTATWIKIILGGTISFLSFFLFRTFFLKRLQNTTSYLEPSHGKRCQAAILQFFARTIPGLIVYAIIFEILRVCGIIDTSTLPLFKTILIAAISILLVEAGVKTFLISNVPNWRLVPLVSKSRSTVKILILSLITVFSIDQILSSGAYIFGGNQELAFIQSAIVAVLISTLLYGFFNPKNWLFEEYRKESFNEDFRRYAIPISVLIRAIAVITAVAAVIGYVALAYLIAIRLFLAISIILTGLFLKVSATALIQTFDEKRLARNLANNDPQENEGLIIFWVGAIFDLLIILMLSPVMALALGVEWIDVVRTIKAVFFGFEIGSFKISVAQILSAIAAFVFLFFISRTIQNVAEKHFFPKTRLDNGVRNSLKTIIGYIGLVVAFMVAISVMGFSLANFAIIAGALSLGIGFGLQSIVNNFVSGLILLFERPVKVGDWIAVSSGEGTVKRISVRSTEIETVERSSIIVPNSELISSSVKNWTHKDRSTRLTIPIGVSYNSDPQRVLELLQSVINGNQRVMSYPAPSVFFGGFGDSSLDFELRIFIRDPADRIPIQNELRVAVFNALKKEKIDIPFPQRDLNIKGLTKAQLSAL